MRKRITAKEFKYKAYSGLRKKFSRFQIDRIRDTFRGDMNEPGQQRGISEKELGAGIKDMRKHQGRGGRRFSSKQIDAIDEELRKHL